MLSPFQYQTLGNTFILETLKKLFCNTTHNNLTGILSSWLAKISPIMEIVKTKFLFLTTLSISLLFTMNNVSRKGLSPSYGMKSKIYLAILCSSIQNNDPLMGKNFAIDVAFRVTIHVCDLCIVSTCKQ